MNSKDKLLQFARTINDRNDRLPVQRSDCFDIGQWGGCGINCPVFLRGDCDSGDELISEVPTDDEDYQELKEIYTTRQ